MNRAVSIGDRKFIVIRSCRTEHMTDELKESIKMNNRLIDVVLSDNNGNLLFCHEPKEAQFRDIKPGE